MAEDNDTQPNAAPDPETNNHPNEQLTAPQPESQPNPEVKKQFKDYWEIVAVVISIITAIVGPFQDQIVPYIAIFALCAFALEYIFSTRSMWKEKARTWAVIGTLALSGLLLIWVWWISRPHFDIQALNTLENDPQAYEITDFLIWNRAKSDLDKYGVKTNYNIQIVPTYFGKKRYGEVVLRISKAPKSDKYLDQTIWTDFDSTAQSQKLTISLADLIAYSGIKEDLGGENKLEKFSYQQSQLYLQIFPVSQPGIPWQTATITIRNAPWDQRVDVVWRDGHNDIDLYLKNYGAPGEFFTHYKVVRLDDVGSTPLEHSTNSATTRVDGGSIEVKPRILGTNQSTTFSIPIITPSNAGRYAVEVYTVKRQRFVNWEEAYSVVSWWFAPASKTGYFIIRTGKNDQPTPFETEAARLQKEQNIDLGVPTGPVEDIKSKHNVPGQRQKFTNGMVIIYNNQVYALYGPVYQHYKALDNGYFPTSPIVTIQRGDNDPVDRMEFEPVGESDMPSAIYANEKHAAWIEGWIRSVYEKSDGVSGWLGLPVSDLMYRPDSNTQAFENGYIVYYFPKVNGEPDYGRQPVILPYANTLGANSKIFDVQAASWQESGLEAKEGDLVWVEYIGGTWTDSTETNPDGYSAGGNSEVRYVDGTIFDKAMLGTLIARVGGENQPIFSIGRWAVFVAPTTGKLELAMNDSSYEHNAGCVTVKIDIIAK